MKIKGDFITNSSSTSFILILEEELNKQNFIRLLGAKDNTFAATLLGQMYDAFKDNSANFKDDYEKYHAKEYDSFEEYLEKNKNFKDKTIQRIIDAYKNGKKVYIGGFDSAGNTPMESYLCVEDFLIDEEGIYIDGLEDGW